MRALLILLVIVVIGVIVAVATGLIDVNQTKNAQSPQIRVEGGQLPSFDVKTPEVSVGTTNSSVTVPDVSIGTRRESVTLPTVSVKKPDQQAEPQPQPQAQ